MAYYSEEVEVHPDHALKDLELFATVYQEIRNNLNSISQLKLKKPDGWKETVQELQIEGALNFLTLKKLNRMAQIRCKTLKDATLHSKQKVYGNNLRLQNLQYEISHLVREVNNCLQFKSKHEDIALVSVEEFYEQSPGRISKEKLTSEDTHLQILARLDWELENRKALKSELKQTHGQKEKVSEAIKKKKHDLSSLGPNLELVLKSTVQLQQAMGDGITATKLLHETARFLPRPLYVLFFQAKAYAEAFDPDITVNIEGDKAAAQIVRGSETRPVVNAKSTHCDRYQDYSDSDTEERDEQEYGLGRRKSTARSSSPAVSDSVNSRNIMEKHPLNISLKINLESRDPCLYVEVKFFYYTQLEFVATSLELHHSADIKDNPFLSTESMLSDLHEPDRGQVVPNRMRAKYFSQNNHETLSLGNGEFAYLWAQRISGLEFLNESTSDIEVSSVNMPVIIRLLRRRVLSHISLSCQLEKLTNNIIPCDRFISGKYAHHVHFEISAWNEVTFEVYADLRHTRNAIKLGIALQNDHMYIATARRGGSATVEIAVAISDQYPKKWPVFCLLVKWRGEKTAENDLNIREIEAEVNCRIPEDFTNSKKLSDKILSAQMYGLMSLLDTFVEAACRNDGSDIPAEFATNTLCPRSAKGRARLEPFRYNAQYKLQGF